VAAVVVLELVSCVFPALTRPDSGAAFGFAFTSATGFISVFSFSLETALRAGVLSMEWNVVTTANVTISGFVPEASRSTPFRAACSAPGSSGCGVP
jgi:hypothetical protein